MAHLIWPVTGTRIKDYTGQRFGMLTAVAPVSKPAGKSPVFWRFACDCGKDIILPIPAVKNRVSPSCGCTIQPRKKREVFWRIHGQAGGRQHPTPEYRAWRHMIGRCENPNTQRFEQWGGRGITVCKRWREDFTAFLADMGPKPSPKHSLDRMDGERPYEPGNCRWATIKEQNRNKRNLRMITFRQETLCAAEWAERIGVTPRVLYYRLERGWPIERVLAPLASQP